MDSLSFNHWTHKSKLGSLDGDRAIHEFAEDEPPMTTSVLTRLQEIREERARRRTLWRELSAYTTAGDLNDLEAAIARSDNLETGAETQEIRRFLAAQRNVSQQA
jgi:hypothetical protein